jgi:regulator of sigma E protease
MSLDTVWTVTFNVLLVILGINALIVVHEFGHFIVARLCGVRCEKFYIWFDFWGLKFFKFKWGNTEYGLGVFPLGGYVKMLGQEDNPGELRAEIERARAAQKSDSESPSTTEDLTSSCSAQNIAQLNEAVFAPDSYLAKSVPQRLAIIVAGVAMNFLFAAVCATAAYMVGIEETAPAVGSIVPGSPAWEAGLQTGDKIVAINDSPARVFTDITMAMVGGENGVKLTVERTPIDADSQRLPQKHDVTLKPRKRKNDLLPMIGVSSLPTLNLASEKQPVYPDLEKYFDNDSLKSLKKPNLKIEKVEGIPVNSYAEYMDAQLRKFDQSVHLELSGGSKIVVPAIPMKETGIRFKMGTIVSVLPGSDAKKKGVEVGDIIVSVDGQSDLDPLKLPQLILRKVNEGQQSVRLVVKKKDGQELAIIAELLSERLPPTLGYLSMKDPVGSTSLGLAWGAEPVIEGIAEDAPEITKKLPIGERVTAVKLLHAEPVLTKNSFSNVDTEGIQLLNIGERVDIPYIFDKLLQILEPTALTDQEKNAGNKEKIISVRLQIENEKKETKTFDIPINDSKDWFNTDRGFVLSTEKSIIKIEDFGEALSLGTAKMIEHSLSVYKFFMSLADGSVSPRALGGPVAIVKIAYMIAADGSGAYLMFLCLIGANLAVINIFPMPPLDGGHVVFLLYEGIFRRPPNEIVQVVLSYFGLFLILLLMIWALSLDFTCIPRF